MEVLYFLIPIGLIFLLIAVYFLFWAISSGQYDDLENEANRILFDDSPSFRKFPTESVSSKKEKT